MINPKDIPFMAMYTLGLAAVFSVARSLVLHARVRWHRFVLCGLAIGAAGACRVPGLVLLGIAAAAWAAACLWGAWRHKRRIHPVRTPLMLAAGVSLSAVPAFVVVFLFFPRLHFQLFSGLPEVAADLHSSAAAIPLLFAGRVSDAGDGMIGYAHAFLIVSTPLWMLGLLGAGTVLLAARLREGINGLVVHCFLQALLLAVAAFPWVYILVTHPALHNGLRHMLFGLPPLVILMAYAVERGSALLRERSLAGARVALAAVAACVLLQVYWLIRMHPYQYVSFNLLAGERATIPNRYEAEYWFTSSRHLLEAVAELEQARQSGSEQRHQVKVRIAGPLQAAKPFVPPGFVLTDSFDEADYFLSNTTFRTDLLAEGDEVYRIERGSIPIGVIKRLRAGK